MAVLSKLPVIYIAEHNGWSVSSRTEWLYPEGRMSRVWRGFDIPVDVIDGNDPEAIFATVSRAVAHARAGAGPTVIEGLTYRIEPHIWTDKAAYQPDAEIAEWRRRDPSRARQDPVARTRNARGRDHVDRDRGAGGR